MELEAQKTSLLKELKELSLIPDCNCECDDERNGCQTRHERVPIEELQQISYCHDDQDDGYFRIKCLDGKIRINAAANVSRCGFDYPDWELGWVDLSAPQEYETVIKEQDNIYDQTNTVLIEGRQDGSAFSIYFFSRNH